jgi:hypothetical protein
MKFLAYLVLIAALAIAATGAYFSIIGLKLLFVGGGLSIVVMGSALEIGKLITATFLKQKWAEISLWMKTYLVLATLFLMAITSAGIYGYLSAGYTATSVTVQGYERQVDSNTLKVKDIEQEISALKQDAYNQSEIDAIEVNRKTFVDQHLKLIDERNQQIEKIRTGVTSAKDASVDIISAKQALDVAKQTLDSDTNTEQEQIKLYNSRLEILDQEVKKWLDEGRSSIFRKSGLDKAREVKEAQKGERDEIDSKIKNSQDKIEKLRAQYEVRVKDYNDRVATIEARAKSQRSDVDDAIASLEKANAGTTVEVATYNKECDEKISALNAHKTDLIEQNKNKISQDQAAISRLNSESDQIREKIVHTDVGTFKFIAKSLNIPLDKAVNYFIWMIMCVFDPLAVCLVLAFNVMLIKKKEIVPQAAASTPIPTPSAPILDNPLTTQLPVEIVPEVIKKPEEPMGLPPIPPELPPPVPSPEPAPIVPPRDPTAYR